MRKFYLLVILLAGMFRLNAQPYRNEWIPFVSGQPYSTQQYFRLNVWKEGIYKLTYTDLQTAGVPVNTWFSPDKFQVFHNGREEFIRVIDNNSDNLFTSGDYILFYGQSNDGKLDSAIYDLPTSQANPHLSLFNDTASYFLTYNALGTGLRMPVENDQNFSAYNAAQYCIKEQFKQYVTEYNFSSRDGNQIGDNSYTRGEGYFTGLYSTGNPFNETFNVQKYLPSGPPAEAELTVIGANGNLHPYEIRGNANTFNTNTILAYGFTHESFTPANLTNGSYVVSLVPLADVSNPNNNNYMQVGYTRLRYTRSLDFQGESFPQTVMIENDGQTKQLIEFANTGLVNPQLYIVNEDTVRAVVLTPNGTAYRALIPMDGGFRSLFLISDNSVLPVTGNVQISSVNNSPDPNVFARFTNFLDAGANKDFLIVSHKQLWTKAQDYAAYRNISGYNALLADVDELYDQFAWGVKKHPQAVRGYADFMIDHFGATPKYLFLLGKSVMSLNARSGQGYAMNLVPTFGEPASDQMFTAHLNTTDFKPELATGRLSAIDEADVQAYLDKIISFENEQKKSPAPWMKNVLHFGGGTDLDEQNILSGKLQSYADIIQDTLFGGKVTTFLKSSTAPIQINQSQYLQQMIDSGCTMMTFYGHGAGSTFDISTDDPENYNNKDRYPVVLAQSCTVGDIHTTLRLLDERFVLAPNKGAIGFIAVPDKGIVEPLDDYSLQLHKNIFQVMYGLPVGQCMKQTIADIITPDFDRKSVCMNMTLHGDPAIIMNMYDKPDYSISNSNIFFEPAQVTAELDSFTVKFAISNLGKNTQQTMSVQLSRTFPDGITHKDTIISVPYITYRDTFGIKLPVDFRNGPGLNKFEVSVDVYNEVAEIEDYVNNIASAQLQIQSSDINPVAPQEFAIVPSASVVLKATTANLFATARDYVFQLDTNPFFNSPKLQSAVIQHASGIVSWPVPVAPDSNVAYFWRVANDSILNPDTAIAHRYQWRNSSFMYKPNVTGWSQAHWYQLNGSSLTNIQLDDAQRYFRFVQSNYSLVATHEGNRPSYDINRVNIDYGGCQPVQQMAIVVIDSIDFEHPWSADTCVPNRYFGNYNPYNCNTGPSCGGRTRADKYFLFDTQNPVSMDSMISMLNNKIPNGDYIMAWNVFPNHYSNIPAVINNFVSMGATAMAGLQDTEKFMLFLRKGDPSSAIVKHGPYPDSTLQIDYLFQRDWDKGFITSSRIGPAVSWTDAHWNYHTTEISSSPDSIHLVIIGVNQGGSETILRDSLISAQQPVDLSTISAAQYPYLKLRVYCQDLVNRTPPQLDRWQVYFQPVPEGALNTQGYSFYRDTVQEGDSIRLKIAFENISTSPMDTLLIDYFTYDASNNRRNVASVHTSRDLPAGDSIMTSIAVSTAGMVGNNSLWIEVNPRFDQPEQYHFNNLANLNFTVSKDKTNPLLDVTFDGSHILNGDIVSARPMIQIKLLDENRFLALNDTGNYRVTLKDPKGVLTYLHFEPASGVSTSTQLLSWTPAVLPKNSFTIGYNPVLLTDGIYELAVQATDESGNLSGSQDYRISFEIINKSSITEVINYPNPFSTSTRFVFTLTGSAIPTEFKIQIMTVTGKIIREITRDQIGPIRIGRNITEYAWDGKDEFGDQLANGVYLYRVLTKINDEAIAKRETEADGFFKKGWGKMYLMR